MSVYVQGVEIFTNPTIRGTVSAGTGLTMPAFTLGGDVTLSASRAILGSAGSWLMLAGAASPPAPDSVLHIWGGDAGAVTAGGEALLVIERNSNATIQILTPAANFGGIAVGQPAGGPIAYLLYYNADATPADTWVMRMAALDRLRYSAGAFAFQENTVISRVAAAGVAAGMGFNIPISAGGAANAVVQWYFQLDTVSEAGLFGETDGAGTYTQAKTMWKVPYRDSGANVAAPTAPTTAATWLGGLRVEAGDDTNRIYFYANEAWHYINQTAGLSITAEERVDPWTGHRWEMSDLAVVRMHTAYGDGGADFLPYPLEEALKEILAKPKWREWLRAKLEV